MSDLRWDLYRHVDTYPPARSWLEILANLGLAPNTVSAYARDLDDYLAFCARARIAVATATTAHIARYVDDMAHRPNPRCKAIVYLHSGTGLSNSTMRRRLVVARLFYDYLSDEGLRTTLRNPAARGTFTPGRAFGGRRAQSAPTTRAPALDTR